MRALDRGESFVVTRNGVPVGELTPIRRGRDLRGSRGETTKTEEVLAMGGTSACADDLILVAARSRAK